MARSVSPIPTQPIQPHQQSLDGKPPERSRNAKAQARHRAKRKAYIEQLEQTVTKLQTALALSPDQVTALPPPSARIRQLEHENAALRAEIDKLRRQFQTSHLPLHQHPPQHSITRRASIISNETHFDVGRREPPPTYVASDDYPKALKRRRSSPEEPYLSPDQTPSPPSTTTYARAPTHYQTPPYLATPATTASASPSVASTGTPGSLLSAYALPPPVAHHQHHGHHAQQPSPYSQPSPTTHYDSLQAQSAQAPRYNATTPAYENVKIEDDNSSYLTSAATGYFSQSGEIGWGTHHHQTAYVGGDRH